MFKKILTKPYESFYYTQLRTFPFIAKPLSQHVKIIKRLENNHFYIGGFLSHEISELSRI